MEESIHVERAKLINSWGYKVPHGEISEHIIADLTDGQVLKGNQMSKDIESPMGMIEVKSASPTRTKVEFHKSKDFDFMFKI